MAANDIIEGSFYQELAPSDGSEVAPQESQAAQIIRQLHASGKSLDDIAEQSDVPRRTIDDILYGRSSGARSLPKLLPLAQKLQERRQERQLLDQIYELSRRQAFQEQQAKIAETARAAAAMEIAVIQRAEEMRLYNAAVRYLGPRIAGTEQFYRYTPAGRQQVIAMAQQEQAASAERPIPLVTQNRTQAAPRLREPAPARQMQQIAPSTPPRHGQLQIAAPVNRESTPAYITQDALVAAHGPNCECTLCALAPWKR